MELISICLSVEEGTEAPRQWHEGCGEQLCLLSLAATAKGTQSSSACGSELLCASSWPGWNQKGKINTSGKGKAALTHPEPWRQHQESIKTPPVKDSKPRWVQPAALSQLDWLQLCKLHVNSKPFASCQPGQPRISAPPFSKNTFTMPTLPVSIFLCLLFYEPVSSLSPHHAPILCECAHCPDPGTQTPHLPCARGCKGRVGCPGWMVSSPWRCRDRRCCCCNCCICKSCCWKANCCVATCCCWGWKKKQKQNKNAHLLIQE